MKSLVSLLLALGLVFVWSSPAVIAQDQEPPVCNPEAPAGDPTACESVVVQDTEEPTVPPTEEPTVPPTEEPTVPPTEEPTVPPTEEPTVPPTEEPTVPPTEEPTVPPTEEPTEEVIEEPVEEEIVEEAEEAIVEPDGLSIIESADEALEASAVADVSSAAARTAPWSVSVTYQNVGGSPATITVEFYDQSGTKYTYTPPALNAGAGASFAVGSLSTTPAMPSTFKGSAVMSSDQPLVATVVQFSTNTLDAVLKQMRLISNGFQSGDASNQYLIATTLLNKFDRTTVFHVQNTESVPINATIKFYDADNNGVLAGQITHPIPANAVKIIEMDNCAHTGLTGCPTVFNGSAIITAEKQGGGAANVVAAASEYYINRNVGANFEGVPLSQAATKIYMATALCRKFGLDTFYAVQNASLTNDAYVMVTYKNLDGTVKTTDGRVKIGPGQKWSAITCSPNSGADMTGFSGSAVIESFNAASGATAGAPIVAIGKASTSALAPLPQTANAFTAFMSQPSGVSKIAIPFVRFANDGNFNANNPSKQRTYVAIQNLETSSIKVNVTYKDKVGNTVGSVQTLTIAGQSKGNTDPASAGALSGAGMVAGEFGYYTDGTFGGGAIIEAHSDNPTAKFIAIVRAANGGGAQEDFNGPVVP